MWRPIHGLLGWDDDVAAKPDHVAFPGIEAVWVAGPLDQVLTSAPTLPSVQDGLHIKVVRWRHLLQLQPVKAHLQHQPLHRLWGLCLALPPLKRSPLISGPCCSEGRPRHPWRTRLCNRADNWCPFVVLPVLTAVDQAVGHLVGGGPDELCWHGFGATHMQRMAARSRMMVPLYSTPLMTIPRVLHIQMTQPLSTGHLRNVTVLCRTVLGSMTFPVPTGLCLPLLGFRLIIKCQAMPSRQQFGTLLLCLIIVCVSVVVFTDGSTTPPQLLLLHSQNQTHNCEASDGVGTLLGMVQLYPFQRRSGPGEGGMCHNDGTCVWTRHSPGGREWPACRPHRLGWVLEWTE